MPGNIESKTISQDEIDEDIPEVLPVTEEELKKAKKEGRYIDTSEKEGEWVKNEEGVSEFKKKENLENAVIEEEKTSDKIKNEKGKLERVFKEKPVEETKEEVEEIIEVLEKKLEALKEESVGFRRGVFLKKLPLLNPMLIAGIFKGTWSSIIKGDPLSLREDPEEKSREVFQFLPDELEKLEEIIDRKKTLKRDIEKQKTKLSELEK